MHHSSSAIQLSGFGINKFMGWIYALDEDLRSLVIILFYGEFTRFHRITFVI